MARFMRISFKENISAPRVVSRTQRCKSPVHIDYVLLGHFQHCGDFAHLFGRPIAVLDHPHVAPQSSQVEEGPYFAWIWHLS
jgi:hypothetical protein